MSIPKITGQQARELLDGTIDGPWSVEVHKRHDIIVSPGGYALAYNEDEPDIGRPNSELLAAAPTLAETVTWLWSELEKLRDFADEDFRPSNYAEIATYDPLGAEKLRAAEETVRLVHRQYQRRIHGIFRATEEARP